MTLHVNLKLAAAIAAVGAALAVIGAVWAWFALPESSAHRGSAGMKPRISPIDPRR